MTLKIWTDGASSGAPGPSGIGIVIRQLVTSTGHEELFLVEEISEPIGRATCNEAEYWAIIRAMRRARELGATELDIKCDSLVVVNQFSGQYQTRDTTLARLLALARKEAATFTRVSIKHIYDVHNLDADRLSKKASQRARNTAGGLK